MGMPGCETSCRNVSVPYPFGMGPSYCYHLPGFKLTCDLPTGSGNPPRLLLGEDDTFRVVEISLSSSPVRVVRTGTILNATFQSQEVTSDSVFSMPGGQNSPYFLSSGNELVVTGCNAVEVLLHGGAVDDNDINASPSLCGLYAPIRASRRDKYCSGNNQRVMSTLASYVFIAEEGWFAQPWVADQLLDSSPARAALEVPIVLHWTFNYSQDPSFCKHKHSVVPEGKDTCMCWLNHAYRRWKPRIVSVTFYADQDRYKLSVEVGTLGASLTKLTVRVGGSPLLCVSRDGKLSVACVYLEHVTVWTQEQDAAAWLRSAAIRIPTAGPDPRYPREKWFDFDRGSMLVMHRSSGVFILDLHKKAMEKIVEDCLLPLDDTRSVAYEMDLVQFFLLQLGCPCKDRIISPQEPQPQQQPPFLRPAWVRY